MAFSFNWAGTNIQQINPQQSRQAYEDAKNLGEAAMGARKMIGMQKYADLIRNGSGANAGLIAEIKAEIQRLENRNKELQSMATGYPGVQAEPQSYDEMRLRDEYLRNARAGYMTPKGDPIQDTDNNGLYAPNTYELLQLTQPKWY